MNNATVVDLNGKAEKQMELPLQFEEPVRPDLIRRAFHALATMRLQPKGTYPLAGLQTTAEYFGRRHRPRASINVGRSRLPREKLSGLRLGKVRRVPHSRSGRRAHPPKIQKILIEKINFKEKNKAIRSAIAATIIPELVKARGHKFNGTLHLPLIVTSSIESIKRVQDARIILDKLGLKQDLERAAQGRRLRSGRSRLRKGGFRTPKSVLIVFAQDAGIWRATRNIPGVEAISVEKLDAERLAPGGGPGRLTLWTESAVKKMAKEQLFE